MRKDEYMGCERIRDKWGDKTTNFGLPECTNGKNARKILEVRRCCVPAIGAKFGFIFFWIL